jgi:phospholipase/lecithinase/hemolysin
MNMRNIICVACGLIVVSFLASNAQARHWQSLYAFGDSYTDSGAGFVDGNGPTAVVYLADSLRIPFTYAGDPNSSGKSLNFAVSGARTGKGDGMRIRSATAGCGPNDALLGVGMQTQVRDFARRVNSGTLHFDPNTTLFFIAGGLNDRGVPTAETIANLEGEIRQIVGLGGKNFLVALLPTKIPDFAEMGVRLNPALARIPKDLEGSLKDVRIRMSSWGEYFDRVIKKPADYGITNTTDQCAGRAIFGEDSTPCAAPDAFFYFHSGHPSAAVHRIVGRGLEREVAQLFP